MENDEKFAMRQAMEAAIFGNKKRKRGDVEGLNDNDDDFNKRLQERRQEREGNSQDDEEMQKQLLEGGKERALEHMKMKQLIEEEELSDDEIK